MTPARYAFRIAVTALVLGSGTLHAAPTLAEGFDLYGGATLGAMVVQPDHLEVDKNRDASGAVSGGLFLGRRVAFLPVGKGWPLDVELGLQNIARHTISFKAPAGSTDLSAKGHAVSLSAKLGIPFSPSFGMYGRLGVAHASVKGSTPAGQPPLRVDGRATGLVSGLGVEVQYDSGPVLRVELTGYDKSSANSSAAGLNVGLAFRF